MSIWVEIHCDALTDVMVRYRLACAGKNGDQPGAMVALASDVPLVIAQMRERAIADGWVVSRGKYTCPACRKYLANENETI